MCTIDNSANPRYDKKLIQGYLEGDYGGVPDLASDKDFRQFADYIRNNR